MRAQDNASAIDEDDFSDWLFGSDCTGAWVVEIKQFTGQWQLDHILAGNWFRIVDHREYLETRVHSVDDFGFDR